MEESPTQTARTTIAPDVLLTIARLEALRAEGVVRMSPVPGGVNRLFKRSVSEGVRIVTADNDVTADLFIVVKHGANIREVSRNVQARVARAIEEMVGMNVASVNIHIEDVAFDGEEE